jgi:tagatose 6-phosphate kinase
VYFAQIPAVKIVSAVGSGDALVAGFLAGLEENWSVATCLKFANAVAISNACNVGAGVIDLEQVRKLESLITITELKLSPQ